ncbi:MAG TPA: murein transglycosylase A [Geminicoccaceae bacterium]|nr:murein transglycosylase A [Geminicoccaceae bacterium]
MAPAEPEPELSLRPLAFDRLEGWSADDPSEALFAFRRSCVKLRASGSGPMGPDPAFGAIADWLAVCTAADEQARAASAAAVRRFFETWFQPYEVFDRDDPEGLFTGYYEPVLHGSRRSGPRYPVPLHAPPADLLRIDLGRFNPELAGYAIYGRIGNGEFLPYYSRAEIERGVLAGRNLELLWVDDPIAKFFLQIQGSGQVRLDDGSVVRVGYASQNGHPYRAIGRDLIEIGALTRNEVSLQTIRAWLHAHPDDAPVIMARNRSYIFFREHPELAAEDGPLGAQGVPLIAGRSLAVDRRYVPLGVPVWLDTTAPGPAGATPLRRLMIAQDTGGAIKGVVRGDVFWGAGEPAEAVAGRMRSPGRYAVLLPRALIPTS